jgi:predicted nucleic acid-binding protein
LRIFLDSNVLISGIYSPVGAPYKILRLHLLERLRIVVCQLVINEVIRNLKAKKPEGLPVLYRLLSNSPPEIAANPRAEDINIWKEYLDNEDAIILAAAISARVDCFISGDWHFHSTGLKSQKLNLKILAPAEFVAVHK